MKSDKHISRRKLLLAAGAMAVVPVGVQAAETIYRYDALGRVAGVIHPNGSTSWYQYDSAGNRTSKRSGGSIYPNGFDADYYRLVYVDLFNANMTPQNAKDHYDNHGRYEGRNPSAYFSTTGYLNAYPDVAMPVCIRSITIMAGAGTNCGIRRRCSARMDTG